MVSAEVIINYFPFHVGDYVAATAHLSWDEDMAYTRLIRVYYQTEKPIPADRVYRLARASSSSQKKAVDSVLAEFFDLVADGYRQSRCEEEIAKFSDKQSKAKRSAETRWKKQGDQCEVDANAMRTHNKRNANQNQEPKPNSVTEVTGGKPPLTPDEIIFGYGVPILTNAGTAEKQARSFLGGLRKYYGDDALVNTLRDCLKAKPLQPLEWLAKAMPPSAIGASKPNKQEALEARNRAIADAWATEQGAGIETV